jgi:hypothetical protein
LDEKIRQLRDSLRSLGGASPEAEKVLSTQIEEAQRQRRAEEEEADRATREERVRYEAEIAPLQAQQMERLKEAKAICDEAQEDGDGTDCDKKDATCQQLASACGGLPQGYSVALQPEDCPSKEDLMDQLMARPKVDGEALEEASLVETGRRRKYRRSYYYYDRRRRRYGGLAMTILFPRYYYYGYRPYCYPWYGYGHHYYAYPIVPNVGGYTFGLGTFHPGLMLIEGIGHLAFHTVRGLMWAGGQLVEATTWGIGSLFKFVGECKGDAAKGCIAAAVVIAVIVALLIWAVVYYTHCVKDDANCKSWWYKGGRLRRKMKKWLRLWHRIEDHVYEERNSYLLFDGTMDTPDRCMKKLQWGRDWARMSENAWDQAPANASKIET